MSHATAKHIPPPAAIPLTAAITGASIRVKREIAELKYVVISFEKEEKFD
jgi:hypothetical protein